LKQDTRLAVLQETNKEEAEAKRRNEERARKTAEQASEKARQNAAAEKEKAAQNSVKNAVDQTKLLEDERLRWRVTLCLGAACLPARALPVDMENPYRLSKRRFLPHATL
jgi:hypothetical protein